MADPQDMVIDKIQKLPRNQRLYVVKANRVQYNFFKAYYYFL